RRAEKLQAERERLEAVIAEMPVGVVLAEAPSGRMVSVNRKAISMWGSPTNPPQAIEDYANWKALRTNGEPYRTQERPLARAILKGETVQGEEAEIERTDGTRCAVRFNAAPLRDSRGVISAAVGTIVDI